MEEKMSKKYRVIQWGLGYTGRYSAGYILRNPNLQLVGAACFTAGKDGKDIGELCGLDRTGLTATRNTDSLLDTAADCVIYMPLDPLTDPSLPDSSASVWLKELLRILASGKNVVASMCSGAHYRNLARGEEFRRQINEACEAGKSSVFFTGLDPGFISDALALNMASAVGDIEQIRTWEILDYSNYPQPEILNALGFGMPPEALSPQDGAARIGVMWGGLPYIYADALGVTLEDTKIDADIYISPTSFTAPGGCRVEAGTIGALRFSVAGIVGGRPRFVVNHVTRLSNDMAPDWPRIGELGGYRIEIDGYPPFKGEFPMGLPGGSGSSFADAMIMTAARCVSSIDAIVQATPGYKTFLDLTPLAGKFTLAR
jgi:4-hydroxy-tetrahydrodipicolinate reductase